MKNILITEVSAVSIGCDPEVFLVDNKGEIVPACGLIGGNKECPLFVKDGNLQEDNIMGEFGTDPSLTERGFVRRVNSVYKQLVDATEYDVLVKASAIIKDSTLDAHDAAKVFGCDPDFNAYSLTKNPTPSVDSNLRTCAGHMHMGFQMECSTSEEFLLQGHVAKFCDAVVGLWCTLVDTDSRRMSRYGQAGAFRPKPYGIEYRVPSNFWLKDDKLKAEIFNRMRLAYDMARHEVKIPFDEVQLAINTSDKQKATNILGELECLNV